MQFQHEDGKEELFSMRTETTGFFNSRFVFRVFYKQEPFVRMEGIPKEEAQFVLECIKRAYEKGVRESA